MGEPPGPTARSSAMSIAPPRPPPSMTTSQSCLLSRLSQGETHVSLVHSVPPFGPRHITQVCKRACEFVTRCADVQLGFWSHALRYKV